MDDGRGAKRFLLVGAIIGGLISIAIALMMDMMYADTLQGTWRDAIAKDLNTFLHLGVNAKSIVVYLFFLVVLGILAAFGGLLGFIFSFFMYKFFSFLGTK
ncbi:MAG: hypothetical protein M0024_05690 [Nitrospiraceae bacterium]|nr:hypothetical protein [Nitrospiraceae bacterium]